MTGPAAGGEPAAFRRGSWAQPQRWAVLTGLGLFPLFIGKTLADSTYILNEWQVLMAMGVGALVGGILLALAWSAARDGHHIVDALGRGGVVPMAALWVLWAGTMGMMTVLWGGGALSAVLPGSPLVWTIALGVAGLAVALAWRAGYVGVVGVLAALTLAAAVIIAPHVAATGSSYTWHMADGNCALCSSGPGRGGLPPFAVRWPYYWMSLVNAAALAAACVLTWGPMAGPSAGGRSWGPALAAAMVAGLALMVIWAGQLAPIVMVASNPASTLLSLNALGPWHNVLVAALAGVAMLWMATVWAAGPPSRLLGERTQRWLTGLAVLAALAGAWAQSPIPPSPPVLHPNTIPSLSATLATFAAQNTAGLRLAGAAYVLAPLIALVSLSWAVERLPACRRWGLRPLGGALTAGVWIVSMGLATPWISGFGQFGGGPFLDRLVPGFHHHANRLWTAPDWALAVGMGAAVVLYAGVVFLRRWPPWHGAGAGLVSSHHEA